MNDISSTQSFSEARLELRETIVIILMGTFAPQAAEHTPIYSGLAQIARQLGFRTLVKSLPKVGLGNFESMIDQLDRDIYGQNPDCQVILIGHSQGATAAHALAHCRPSDTRVVIAISPPTHGTALAALPGSRFIPIARHLRTHSPEMRALRNQREYPPGQVHVFYSVLDQFVLPFLSSQVRGANNILVAPKVTWPAWVRLGQRSSLGVTLVDGTCDHLSITMHKQVHRQIVRVIGNLPSDHRPASVAV